MASVQELLAAANAKRATPMSNLMEDMGQVTSAMGGYEDLLNKQLARKQAIVSAQQVEEDRARVQQTHNTLMAIVAGAQEEQVKTAFNAVAPTTTSPHPGLRLASATVNEHGYMTPKFEVLEPKPAESVSFQAKDYLDAQKRTRIGSYNPKTREFLKSSNDPFAPQTARGETQGVLRKEFIDRPEVKEYVTIGTQVKSMDAMLGSALAGNQQNQVALDQALITMYNKLTDPTSVVRESEYARTGENLPLVNRISGAIGKVQSGGAGLTDADRQALVLGAKIIANERGTVFNQRRAEYNTLAQKMDMDPAIITGTLPEFKLYKLDGGAGTAPATRSFTHGKYKVTIVQ